MTVHVALQMLVSREPSSAFDIPLGIGAVGRFRGLSFEPESSAVRLLVVRELERASVGFRFVVHGLDVRLEVGISQEGFVASLGVFGALERAIPGVRADMLFESTWASKRFIAAFVLAGEFWREKNR